MRKGKYKKSLQKNRVYKNRLRKSRLFKSKLCKGRFDYNLENCKRRITRKKSVKNNKERKVKHRFRMIVKLKAIKCLRECLCYLSSYISFSNLNFYIYFLIIFSYHLIYLRLVFLLFDLSDAFDLFVTPYDWTF